MAQTIPEKLSKQTTTPGERRVFDLLKRLPDEVVVYFEPVVSSQCPDFAVILPTFGVVIIEVKDWLFKNITGADPDSVWLWDGQGAIRKDNPLRQVRDYKFKLRDQCRKDRHFSDLCYFEGQRQREFQFPFASFAVLSNITREEIHGTPEGENVFPTADVVTSDQLRVWEKLSPDALLETLGNFFKRFWIIEKPMTGNQVNIVKAILHPEIVLELNFNDQGGLLEPTVKVLDLNQETIARNIGEGHRLVFGVAGSGKTVILLSRAKLISRLNPSARVLVLCFNVALSAKLTESLKDCSTVTVSHFDRWAKSNGIVRDNGQFKDSALLGRKLLAALDNGAPDKNRYDVVLIDEAQDFAAEWFLCALKAMKDPINGELLIVGDGSQGVYGRRKVSWKSLGIQAQGRTRYLDQNYRNTRQILELASLFAVKDAESDEDSLLSPLVDPSKSARTHGIKPVILKSRSQEEEIARTVHVIDRLLSGHWFGQSIEALKPHEIAILYPRADWKEQAQIENLQVGLRNLDPEVESIWLNTKKTDARRRIGEPGVKIMNIHTAKGLQFRAVIILFCHECPANFADTPETEERCLFYVGLTRPEDFLVVSASGHSKFIAEIEASGFASL